MTGQSLLLSPCPGAQGHCCGAAILLELAANSDGYSHHRACFPRQTGSRKPGQPHWGEVPRCCVQRLRGHRGWSVITLHIPWKQESGRQHTQTLQWPNWFHFVVKQSNPWQPQWPWIIKRSGHVIVPVILLHSHFVAAVHLTDVPKETVSEERIGHSEEIYIFKQLHQNQSESICLQIHCYWRTYHTSWWILNDWRKCTGHFTCNWIIFVSCNQLVFRVASCGVTN